MERKQAVSSQPMKNATAVNNNTPKPSVLRLIVKFGKFNAGNIILDEVSFNDKVLRVPVEDVLTTDSVSKVSTIDNKEKPMEDLLDVEMSDTLSQINPQQMKEKISNQLQKMFEFDPPAPEPYKHKIFQNKSIRNFSSSINDTKTKDLSMNSTKVNKNGYYLSIPEDKPPQEGKLQYDFNKLMRDLKTMKLPTPEWRIKIIKKKESITGIVFTDKKELERSVNFSLRSDYYKILIESKPVILLGAPPTIDSVTDLEQLLDIVQNISSTDQMLLYT